MLVFSFASLFMAIVSSNLAIAVLAFVFRKKERMEGVGLLLIEVFCICTVLRMMFPFEILSRDHISFAKPIYLPEKISNAISVFLFHPFLEIENVSISLWNTLLVVWLVVFLVLLVITLISECRYVHFIRNKGRNSTEDQDYAEFLKESRKRIAVYEIPVAVSPSVFFFLGTYYLVMPDSQSISFNKKERKYILKHEMEHIHHGDLLKQKLIHFLCLLYWWNPIGWKFIEQTDQVFDMRVDQEFLDGTPEEREGYVECLLRVKKFLDGHGESKGPGICFSAQSTTTLINRFHLFMNPEKPKKREFIPIALLLTGIYLLSLFLVLELEGNSTDFKNQVQDKNIILSTSENTYLIENEDGSYDVYFEEYLVDHVDSLENYRKGYPIYKSKEEALKHENIQ